MLEFDDGFVFYPWQRKAWPFPPDEEIYEWAEREVQIPQGKSSNPGPISFGLTPFMREWLRAVRDPETRRITLMTSAQVAKTMFQTIVLLYYMRVKPSPQMVVFPTEDNACEFNDERVAPMIMGSPDLAQFVKSPRDIKVDIINLNGSTVWFRGAHSPAGLASKASRVLLLDEVDKYPPWSGQEADPISLAKVRQRTYGDSIMIDSSTPTTDKGYIASAFADGTQERYHVPCPHCGEFQPLVFGDGSEGSPGIKWPKDATPDEIQQEQLAWYECRGCAEKIWEQQKHEMVRSGVWAGPDQQVVDGEVVGDPIRSNRHRSFHIWTAYSLWEDTTFSDIATEFLEAQGKEDKLMHFRNSTQGETWKVVHNELKDQHIRDRSLSYPQGRAPNEAWFLTAGVDVQSTGGHTYQYYSIRAWGAGGKSWLVRSGRAISWEHLIEILFKSQYRREDGDVLTLEMVTVDANYQEFAHEVYQFCEMTNSTASIGSAQSRRNIQEGMVETAPGSGVMVQRLTFRPDYFKSKVHFKIRHDEWFIHSNVEQEFFDHMVAEQLVSEVDKRTGKTRAVWRVVAEGRPNHLFDCEVLNCLGAEFLGVEYLESNPFQSGEEPEPGITRIRERQFS